MSYTDKLQMPDGTVLDIQTSADKVSYGSSSNVKTELDRLNGLIPTAGKQIKVLAIGNSYCENMFAYVRDLASNLGVTNLAAYNLFKGGQTIAGWWNSYKTETNSGQVEKWCGEIDDMLTGWHLAQEMAAATDWDVIILQQFISFSSSATIDWSLLSPALTHLVSHLRHDCPNKNVRIGMQMEWAKGIGYNEASNTSGYQEGESGYANLAAIAKSVMDNGQLDFVIPTGTAIINAAMNSTLNTRITSDTDQNDTGNAMLLKDRLHLADGVAKYIAACTFWESVVRPINGVSIAASTLNKSASNQAGSIAVDNNNRDQCHAAVYYAISNPWMRSTLDFANF